MLLLFFYMKNTAFNQRPLKTAPFFSIDIMHKVIT